MFCWSFSAFLSLFLSLFGVSFTFFLFRHFFFIFFLNVSFYLSVWFFQCLLMSFQSFCVSFVSMHLSLYVSFSMSLSFTLFLSLLSISFSFSSTLTLALVLSYSNYLSIFFLLLCFILHSTYQSMNMTLFISFFLLPIPTDLATKQKSGTSWSTTVSCPTWPPSGTSEISFCPVLTTPTSTRFASSSPTKRWSPEADFSPSGSTPPTTSWCQCYKTFFLCHLRQGLIS